MLYRHESSLFDSHKMMRVPSTYTGVLFNASEADYEFIVKMTHFNFYAQRQVKLPFLVLINWRDSNPEPAVNGTLLAIVFSYIRTRILVSPPNLSEFRQLSL